MNVGPLAQTGLAFLCLYLWLPRACAVEDDQQPTVVVASTNSLHEQLIRAISTGDEIGTKAILRAAPALANNNNNAGLLLALAAHLDNLEILRALLDAGAPVDAAGEGRRTALRTALDPLLYPWGPAAGSSSTSAQREARLAMAQLLLERRASIFAGDQFDQSVIGMAVRWRATQILDFLLVNQRPVETRDAAGNSVAHLAALWGRTNALKAIAAAGADLESTNGAGLSPLHAVSRLRPLMLHGSLTTMMGPGIDADGPLVREATARLLISLGATLDLFAATALGWTNSVADMLKESPELARSRDAAGRMPLHWAAEFGEEGIAGLLLKAGAPVEGADYKGEAPLDVAAATGHAGVAVVLLKNGAPVIRPPGRKTPLHWAAEQGNLALIEHLLNVGAEKDARDDHDHTAMDLAAARNQEPAVRLLVARQARLKLGESKVTTPLHWAAVYANTNLAWLCLRQGADINAHDESGRTPLHLAHERDNFRFLEFLLANGADINAVDTNGNTALHIRATAGTDRFPTPPGATRALFDKVLAYPWVNQWVPLSLRPPPPTRSMMGFLLDHRSRVNATNHAGKTALHRVISKQFTATNAAAEVRRWIQPLLRRHANLDARADNGRTALFLAVQAKNLPVLEALIDSGANPSLSDTNGFTPLHEVIRGIDPQGASVPIVELLLKAGARLNATDTTGATPLHLAARKDTFGAERPVVQLLLKSGADLNTLDGEGRTPLHLASGQVPVSSLLLYQPVLTGDSAPFLVYCGISQGKVEETVAEMLLTNGAKVNVSDQQGNTPLHYAAEATRVELVELLLEKHADRKLRNRRGLTPLQLAYEQPGGFRVIPLLQPPGVFGEIADAARRGDVGMVKAFIDDDPRSVDRSWLFSSTGLQWACNQGHLAVVELLLEHGSAVNPPRRAPNYRIRMVEFNALMNTYGAESNRLENARSSTGTRASSSESVASGGAAEAPERDGDATPWYWSNLNLTPLQLALAGGHTEIARLLIKNGANVDLASASTLGLVDILKLEIGIEPTRVDEFSRRATWACTVGAFEYQLWLGVREQSGTLLHFAARAGQSPTIEFLLAAGANPSALDDKGRTPYQLASEAGETAAADCLNRHGADRIAAPR